MIRVKAMISKVNNGDANAIAGLSSNENKLSVRKNQQGSLTKDMFFSSTKQIVSSLMC